MRSVKLVLVGSTIAVAGCEGCRSDKPYTPFGVTSAIPKPPAAVASSAARPATSAAPPVLVARKAAFAPRDAKAVTVAGKRLESPEGRVFEQFLDADLDGDGTAEVAAWTLPEPSSDVRSPGELWLYRGGAPEKIFDFPPFLPTGGDCKHTTELSLAGTRLLSVDIAAKCESPRLARSPTRALGLVDPGTPGAPRFGLRVADPAPGESLSLQLLVRDEDADGRDDFRLEVSLGVPGTDTDVAASLVWLDRAAGVSRDTREPARGLDAVLHRELVRAKQKKSASTAIAKVNGVRRLLGSICAEGKVPRLFDWDGTPIRCSPLGAVIDRLAATEVTVALTLGDPALAYMELLRDGWYFGSTSTKQRSLLEKDIQKKLPRVAVSRVTLGARPRAVRPPSFSPLAFEPDGTLLLQTDTGVFRLPPDASREELVPPDAGIGAWPLEVVSPTGVRLLGVSYSCDRSEAALLLSGGPDVMQTTPLLAPRPGVCAGGPFAETLAPLVITAESGPRVLVGGMEVGGALGPPPRGSARSPNGKVLAVPTPAGLLIRGTESELWQIDGWDGASGCVVASDPRRAACVHRGRAEMYLKTSNPAE